MPEAPPNVDLTEQARREAEHKAHDTSLSFYSAIYLFFIVGTLVVPQVLKQVRALSPDPGALALTENTTTLACLCILTNLRFLLGGLFSSRDTTFRDTLYNSAPEDYERRLVVLYAYVKLLMMISIVRSYAIFTYNLPLLGWLALLIEIAILWRFDRQFKDVLRNDPERKGNIFIVVGDLIYIVTVLLLFVLFPIYYWVALKLFATETYLPPELFMILTSSCGVILVVEAFVSYRQSVKASLLTSAATMRVFWMSFSRGRLS